MSTAHDSDVTNDDTDDPAALSVGGYDVLRLDPTQDIPALSDFIASAQSAGQGLSDDGSWTDLADIGNDAVDFGMNVVSYKADPLNYLISAGLGFLVDVVQPLEDLLGLVTGNAERMAGEIKKWQRVANALVPLSAEIRQAADSGLIGWQGRTADQAKKRLNEFADGVAGVADDVKKLEMIMAIAELIMSTAQALVLSIIATFVEWLVITWAAAMAAAPVTLGGSTAAAGAATAVEAGSACSRGVVVMDKAVTLFTRLRKVLAKIHPEIMKRVEKEFRRLDAEGRVITRTDGWRKPVKSMLIDWKTYPQPVAQGVDDILDVVGGGPGGQGARPSGQRLDDDLDPDR